MIMQTDSNGYPQDNGSTQTSQAGFSEKRTSQRRRVLKGGNIYFNRGYGAYSCTVKNLSDGGAMVLMEDSSGLPGEFDFVITGEDKTRKASISWRANGRAGIVFH